MNTLEGVVALVYIILTVARHTMLYYRHSSFSIYGLGHFSRHVKLLCIDDSCYVWSPGSDIYDVYVYHDKFGIFFQIKDVDGDYSRHTIHSISRFFRLVPQLKRMVAIRRIMRDLRDEYHAMIYAIA